MTQGASVSLVRDRMTSPVVTVDVGAPLVEVARLLEEHAVSALPVTRDDRLVGLVSTTDLIGALARDGRASLSAGELMSTSVLSVAPSELIDVAARRLVAGRVHRLVVTEAERAVGILSARDLLAELRHRRVAEPLASIMTTPVETIAVDATVDEAIDRLAAANVHGIVVMEGTMPVGVFTHAEALVAHRLPPAMRSGHVERVMSYETICLDARMPIHRAASYAAAMNVHRLLVVDRREVVGVVSCVDLVGVLARAPEA
jgi:predicted transcriptional regulator